MALLVVLALAGDLWVYSRGRRGILSTPSGSSPRWIVIPGASVRRDGTPSPVLRHRLESGMSAAAAWPDSRLFLSGTSIPGGYSEPDAMRRWLLEKGIPSDRMVVDRAGSSTRATIDDLGPPAGEIVIVSQPWHLPRALWLARHRGWTVRGLAASQEGWAIPNSLREHVVRVFYFLKP